jgi:small subunit ribosomal protein S4
LARYRGSVCRLCRREGEKLFLKGERCFGTKCAIERRSYAPGQHGQRQRKVSDYGVRLREKQKVKRIYGMMECQFRNTFHNANRKQGVTGEILLQYLERRLDNVVFRFGFATSRQQARQLVSHGHITVNGRRVDIPSFQVREEDLVQIKEKSALRETVKETVSVAEHRGMPGWLQLDKEKLSGRIVGLPAREDIQYPIKEQLIVELYSK